MKDLFFLKWKGQKVFLSNLDARGVSEALEAGELRLCYGSEMSEDDQVLVRTEFKTAIETAVNRWINDSRFIIHLLMAVAVFLVSFYFLSYVIRDPLPLVDEVILSLLLAALAWYRLKHQEYQSETVIRRKIELEQYLNDVPREKSEFLIQLELYLEKLSDMEDPELKKLLESGGVPLFFTSEKRNLLTLSKSIDLYRKKNRFNRKAIIPKELKELNKQIRSYFKYHSSMV